MSSSSHHTQLFLQTIQDQYLYQHVHEPTRYRINSTPHTLDLILTNERDFVEDVHYLPGLSLSDHVCLEFSFKCYCQYSNVNKLRYNLHSADFAKMCQLISNVDWEETLNPLNFSEAWHYFSTVFDDTVLECIPLEIPRLKKNTFMSHKALRLKNKKCKLWNRYTATSSLSTYHSYCQVRNTLHSLTRNLRYSYEKKLASNFNSNTKHFWKYVNTRLKSRPVIDSLKKSDDTVVYSDEDKSQLFNQFFTSVFTQEDTNSVPSFHLNRDVPVLDSVTISPTIVYNKLCKLKPDKSPGPEGWPVLALKETAQELSLLLSILFNKSLQSSSVPDTWKQAFVTPIHKKGDRSKAENYRPISLTSTVGKIMESIIRDQVYQYLTANNLLVHNQHGFISGKSCLTHLLHAMNHWTTSLDQNIPVDILYLDFQKAFDSVPHYHLFVKLDAYGIRGKLLDWIKFFLVNRCQKVVLNGVSSNWSTVHSGVPQGSVLGPLLFIIYVNDIPSHIDSQILMFADDTKIFREIKTRADFTQFQKDIDYLLAWSVKWQLKFNISKCYILHLGPSHSYRDYYLDGNRITVSDTIRDLGVMVDSSLKFHSHVNCTITKANRTLGLINRTFQYREPEMIIKLYRSLVRPQLEYGNAIWGPYYTIDQKSIEGIQRRATKMIPHIRQYTYQQRLQFLNLPSLCYRRLRGDMILLYQITHSNTDDSLLDLFMTASVATTRGHNFKFFKPRCNSRCRFNSFPCRTIDNWKNLPTYIVNANSVNSFKNLLDNFWTNNTFIVP